MHTYVADAPAPTIDASLRDFSVRSCGLTTANWIERIPIRINKDEPGAACAPQQGLRKNENSSITQRRHFFEIERKMNSAYCFAQCPHCRADRALRAEHYAVYESQSPAVPLTGGAAGAAVYAVPGVFGNVVGLEELSGAGTAEAVLRATIGRLGRASAASRVGEEMPSSIDEIRKSNLHGHYRSSEYVRSQSGIELARRRVTRQEVLS